MTKIGSEMTKIWSEMTIYYLNNAFYTLSVRLTIYISIGTTRGLDIKKAHPIGVSSMKETHSLEAQHSRQRSL